MKKILKSLLQYLPNSVQVLLSSYYYSGILKKVNDNTEIDFPIVKCLIGSGEVALDIGANIGIYTKFMVDLVGYDGCVYSFEPHPFTYSILVANIYYRLGLKNVKLQNLGLSDKTQELSAIIPVYPSGDKNYYRFQIKELENNENNENIVTLKCVSLDYFWDELKVNNPITFIKIDVEGHELSVIRGSIATLQKFKPALLVEVSGNPDDPISEAFVVFRILSDMGYYAYWFDGTQLFKRSLNDRSINYFFLTENHLVQVAHNLQVQPSK